MLKICNLLTKKSAMKIKNSITTREVNFEENGIVLTLIGNNIIDRDGCTSQDDNSFFWALLKNKEYFKYLFLHDLIDEQGLHETLSQHFFTILQKKGFSKVGDTIFSPRRIALDKLKIQHFEQAAH